MENKTIVVLGSTGSVGRLVTKKLIAQGNKVIAGVRNKEKANGLAELEGASLREVEGTSFESIEYLFKAIQTDHSPIDGIAVCIGSILLKPAHLTSEKEFESIINTNLIPCFAAIRAGARGMMKGGGSIVLVSSAAARQGIPNHEAIAAAKAGVIGLTLSAAATYANYGIRVNCVAPGLVDAEMAQPIVSNEASLKASRSMHALGRIGKPQDVASAILWLLDTEQSWVTGQTIGVDGGLSSLYSRAR